MFRDINAYSATLTGTQLERRGGTSPVHLKFLIQNVVLRISKTNISKMFPCGPFFSFFLCCWRNVYQSALILQPSSPRPLHRKRFWLSTYTQALFFLLIQAYSAPCVTLAYSQHCHILSLDIFRTEGSFKSLWNVDQAYLEPCRGALFSHLQAYSEPCGTLPYAETWHTQILEYPELFDNCIPMHIQNPFIFTKIYKYSEPWHISNPTHI